MYYKSFKVDNFINASTDRKLKSMNKVRMKNKFIWFLKEMEKGGKKFLVGTNIVTLALHWKQTFFLEWPYCASLILRYRDSDTFLV